LYDSFAAEETYIPNLIMTLVTTGILLPILFIKERLLRSEKDMEINDNDKGVSLTSIDG
jgi:hypothetical protein